MTIPQRVHKPADAALNCERPSYPQASLFAPESQEASTSGPSQPSFLSDLDSDSVLEIFNQLVSMGPIDKAVVLRSLNWQVCKAVNYALWRVDHINIELKYNENRLEHPEPLIFVQNSLMASVEKALECLDFMLSHARCIRSLWINVEISSTDIVEKLLEKFLSARNVHLEVLKIRRRYVGQSFPVLSELISKNAETLRVLGKIGLSEAVASFSEALHLDRVSLMNFDLVEEGELDSVQLAEKTKACIRRLSGLGARFEHLSYTAYTGFDISKNPTLYMLRTCEVKSLRLTMQQGEVLSDPPTSRALYDGLTHLELVGCIELPPRCNLSVLFPKLQHFHAQREDLATGAREPPPVQPIVGADGMPLDQLENIAMEQTAAAC